MTRFGKHQDKNIVDLAVEAGLGALNDAAQKDLKVDAVYRNSWHVTFDRWANVLPTLRRIRDLCRKGSRGF